MLTQDIVAAQDHIRMDQLDRAVEIFYGYSMSVMKLRQ